MWPRKKNDIEEKERELRIKELELNIGYLNLALELKRRKLNNIDYLYDNGVK